MARRKKIDLSGQWALITGASSGFGIDFAHLLAERGIHLVLVARRAAPMKALASELKKLHGVSCLVLPMDLTLQGAANELKDMLDANNIEPEYLLNNAGYGLFGDFIEQPLARSQNMLQLNIMALTELTHIFANQMVERGHGRILLVGSLGSFQPLPTYAAYAASKAYVLSFGEALHIELRDRGVSVTVLCPGPTATSFLEVSGQDVPVPESMMMQSRPVAEIGIEAMLAGRSSVVPGLSNRMTAFSNRVLPRSLIPNVAYRLLKK
jgi:short-subunit dehydrogenase